MANTIIQGVNYKAVATNLIDTGFNIVPFDFGGKPLTEMTIVVDTTLEEGEVFLPNISSFNGVYGTTIKVIAKTGGTKGLVIYSDYVNSDKIGSNIQLDLTTDGASAIFTVATEGIWSVLVTA